LALTEKSEGLSLVAYRDSGGVLTIGFGHTGADVTAGMTITLAQAQALLQADLKTAENAVSDLVQVALTPNQFSALVDFAFNVGEAALAGSTLLVLVNRGDFAGAADQFNIWIRAAGQRLPGLVTRRAAEKALFLASDPADSAGNNPSGGAEEIP
jgi:lysozyme